MEFSTCSITLALKKASYLGLAQILDFQLRVSNMYYCCYDRKPSRLSRLMLVDGSLSDGVLRVLVHGGDVHKPLLVRLGMRWVCRSQRLREA